MAQVLLRNWRLTTTAIAIMHILFAFASILTLIAAEEDAQCTTVYAGVSSCDFDHDNTCAWLGVDVFPEWIYSPTEDDGPFDSDYRPPGGEDQSGGYIYAPNGTDSATTETSVSTDVVAMCVNFFYASYEEGAISLYVKVDDEAAVSITTLYTLDTVNTNGQWEQFGLSCCFPEGETRKVGLQTTTGEYPFGVDYLAMTRSERSCDLETDEYCSVVPNPTQAPNTSTLSTRKSTGARDTSTSTVSSTQVSDSEAIKQGGQTGWIVGGVVIALVIIIIVVAFFVFRVRRNNRPKNDLDLEERDTENNHGSGIASPASELQDEGIAGLGAVNPLYNSPN